MNAKRFLFVLCLLLLTTACLCARAEATAPRQRVLDLLNRYTPTQTAAPAEPDYTQIYRSVLRRYVQLIQNPREPGDGETGVWEATSWLSKQEALESVGYAIYDISGDGVPELLVGAIESHAGRMGVGSEIFAAYTVKNGRTTLAFEGWARSRFHWMGGSMFYYAGSSGASSSAFGQFRLDDDGDELLCQDFYFTEEKRSGVIGLYHNGTGHWNAALSSELPISETEFWQIDARLEQNTKTLYLSPLSTVK